MRLSKKQSIHQLFASLRRISMIPFLIIDIFITIGLLRCKFRVFYGVFEVNFSVFKVNLLCVIR